MKRVLLTAALLLLPFAAFESEPPETTEELRLLLQQLDLSEWDAWFLAQNPEIAFVPSDFLQSTVLSGQLLQSDSDWQGTLRALFERVLQPYGIKLSTYLGLGILTSLFSVLAPGGFSVMPKNATRLVCGCAVLTLTAPALQTAVDALRLLQKTAEVLLPGFLTFFSLFDLSASRLAFADGISLYGTGVIEGILNGIVPLALTGMVFYALDSFGAERLSPIDNVCHRAARWMLRLGSSGYLLFFSLRGTIASQSDSLLFRTSKLAAGSLPYVGGLLSGSMDTIYACAMYVRSMLGITGVLFLSALLLRPVLQLLCELIVLRLGAVLLKPVGAREYAIHLEQTASSVGILLSALIAASVMLIGMVATVMGVWWT